MEDLVRTAVLAFDLGHHDYPEVLDALAARPVEAFAALDEALDAVVAPLWTRGWSPADAVHLVEHTLSQAHAPLAVAAVTRDGLRRRRAGERLHPRWVGQLDALGERPAPERPPTDAGPAVAAHLALAVEVLARLDGAPAVPSCVPAPGTAGANGVTVPAGLDQRILARVRALLVKAESTEYAEEAEALTVKAQELIARHAIEDALLQRDDAESADAPGGRRVVVADPYAHPKAALLQQIAVANRCRSTWSEDIGWSTVLGFEADLDAVELLYASLLAQATTALARLGSHRDRVGRSRTTSFRRSFLLGFGHQIGERLRRSTDAEVAAADERSAGGLLPVLAAREDRVRAAQEAAFPDQQRKATSVSNGAGWAAGRTAGQLALLDPSGGVLQSSRAG